MPDVPVSAYTRPTFSSYLLAVLGETADALGWTPGALPVEEAITDALLLVGVDSFTAAPNLRAMRVAGRVAIWRAAVQAFAGAVTSSLDGQMLARSNLQPQAAAALKAAELEAATLGINTGGAGTAVMGRVTLDFLEPAVPWLN